MEPGAIDKAVLVMHEISLREFRQYGPILYTDKIRKFNRLLASEDMGGFTLREYLEKLSEIGVVVTEYNGFLIYVGDERQKRYPCFFC